jgi:ABC-type Zn uptake system ZnuABC Zn-binding protein ZnuA
MSDFIPSFRSILGTVLIALAAGLMVPRPSAKGEAPPPPRDKLVVCCTVRSLGSIAEEIGGDACEVTSFAKGAENPHFIDARPSFVKTLAGADLFIQQGLELEVGWAPVILQQSRNAKVQPGAPGFLDASTVITPMERPTGAVDRSMGDVHQAGNPHYMTDPLNGILVARLVRDKLIELRPDARAGFEERCAEFEKRVCVALVGEKLAAQYPTDTVMKLAQLNESGKLQPFLEKQGKLADLGGWLGALLPFAGTKVISDHNQWVYFARRFDLEMAGYLEPKPGITPTTSHLGELVKLIPEQGVKLVFASPGFDPKSGEFVASKTGIKFLVLAHEVGALDTAGSYIEMLDYDVKQIASALQKT